MLDHDHVRAAAASRYKELRVRLYETTSYVRIIVEAKPLNECWCTFQTVWSTREEKATLDAVPATVDEVLAYLAEALMARAEYPPF